MCNFFECIRNLWDLSAYEVGYSKTAFHRVWFVLNVIRGK